MGHVAMIRISTVSWALLTSFAASAHHSVSAFYDSETSSQIEGRITDIAWINPHVRFTVETVAGNGAAEVWAVESGSVNMLQRRGVSRDHLTVGAELAITGYVSRHGRKEMIAGYITLPSGENVVLWPGLFGGLASAGPDPDASADAPADAQAATAAARGIFRVWSVGQTYSRDATDTSDGMALPYTPAALAARADYDPITDDTALLCIPQGMPGIMDNPFPMEILERGGDIVLRTEEWDVVRTFHMRDEASAAGQPATPWGYSVGRWEDDTLVVATTRIDWPYFDDVGTPQSADLETVERFTLSADGSRLDYTITVTDPVTFTQPITLDGYWTWVPGEIIKPYNCTL